MNWIDLPKLRQVELLKLLEDKTGLNAKSIEKDWWVTLALKALFTSSYSSFIVFKGGTSLSKCWNLIDRFSEDIDLAIDREFLGFHGDLTKRDIGKKLRKASCAFIRGELRDELERCILNEGVEREKFTLEVHITKESNVDPETLFLHYESVLDNSDYIFNTVKIEIGSRSLTEPTEEVSIRSIIGEFLPNSEFADNPTVVKAVLPKRTFLEKAFLLHELFQSNTHNAEIIRMSRHLYDLEKLMDTTFCKDFLKDKTLYNEIIQHREKFTSMSNVDYSTHQPSTINFTPPDSNLKEWEKDYLIMQENMIYGKSLSFRQLIIRIQELNDRFKRGFIE
ncbi:MAG: nucleotidyl transferase AbiEii/AbiGii toxin family protein [Bacteroidales bacterium]